MRWRITAGSVVRGLLVTLQGWLGAENGGCEVKVKRRDGCGALFWIRDGQHVRAGREKGV